MKRYTSQPAYLRAFIAQKPRLDLTGQAVGTVTEGRYDAMVLILFRFPSRLNYGA